MSNDLRQFPVFPHCFSDQSFTIITPNFQTGRPAFFAATVKGTFCFTYPLHSDSDSSQQYQHEIPLGKKELIGPQEISL